MQSVLNGPVQFGASPVGKVLLKSKEPSKPSVSATVYRLTGTPDDLSFLEKGLSAIHRQRVGASMVPLLTGVEPENHFELAEEAFAKALSLLTALQKGELKQPPIVLVALDEANRLLGFSIGHIERHLEDGNLIYTPLRDNLETDKTDGTWANHSSINWLVRFAPEGINGIGKILTAVQERLLPGSVKRVDVVSETPEYTPSAEPLYRQFGFRPTSSQPAQNADFHGILMSTDRKPYREEAEAVLNASEFQPEKTTSETKLSQAVQFPFYGDSEDL